MKDSYGDKVVSVFVIPDFEEAYEYDKQKIGLQD